MERPTLEQVWHDVRHGLRLLARSPLFATVAISAIAVGIAVNASAFAFIDALMLRPLPVADSKHLVKLLAVDARHMTALGFSHRDFTSISSQSKTLRDVVAYRPQPVALRMSSTGSAVQGSVGAVSPNYFTSLGAQAVVGRLINADDARDGATPAVTISNGLWVREFQQRADVLGQTLLLNGRRVTVVGVARSDFTGINPLVPDLWIPLRVADRLEITPGRLDDPANRILVLHGHLRDGFTLKQANGELSPLVSDPASPVGTAAALTRIVGVSLMPSDAALPANAETMLIVVPALFVVGLVLLIASANLGNVFLARALARQREIAIRLAVGASRARLLAQLLTESALVAALGTLLGLGLASLMVSLISRVGLSSVPATYGRVTVTVGLSWRAMGYSAVLATMSVFIFGLLPAIRSTRQDLVSALKSDASSFGFGIRQPRIRSALIAVQVGACVFVLVAVGILVHNLRAMVGSASGFDDSSVVVARFGLTSASHVPASVARDREEFARRAALIPGVARIAQTSSPPYSAWPMLHVASDEARQGLVAASYVLTTPEYFETLGQRVIEGERFGQQDTIDASRVAIISRATERRLWPDGHAVGRLMRVADPHASADRLVRIVGVVSNAQNQSAREADDAQYVYFPATSADLAALPMAFVMRTRGDQSVVLSAMQRLAAEIDPAEPLVATPLRALRDQQILPFRYVALSAAAVGLFALLLAIIGLQGVVSFVVTQRRRDLAIHIALGATTRQVLLLIVRELRAVVVGLAVGTIASIGLVPMLASMTLALSPLPVSQFVAIIIGLAVVASVAVGLPARASLRIGPMEVLRQD